jgi:hypothetical protein
VVIVVKVIRIVKGLTITRVIGIRLPVRCEFSRLAARGDGGRAMVAEEVASTEDADRELLASVHTRRDNFQAPAKLHN